MIQKDYFGIERENLTKMFQHLDIQFMVYKEFGESDYNDDLWVVTDRTNEVPVVGRAVFVHAPSSKYCGEVKNYRSKVVTDATYAQIAHFADAALKATGDTKHIYFRGVKIICQVQGISIVKMRLHKL